MTEKKDPAAVALAKKRAESLTPERRKEIAETAAAKRWGLKKPAKKTPGKKANQK